jgi:hypothetical protein
MEINFMSSRKHPGLVKLVILNRRVFNEISMKLRTIPNGGAIEVKRRDKFGEYWAWTDLERALPLIGYKIVDK